MIEKVNVKKVLVVIAIIIVIMFLSILIKYVIDEEIVKKQMESSINGVTIQENVKLYSSPKHNREIKNLNIGTNAYILENVIDKEGNELYKVKIGDKVGYVFSENIDYYTEANMKKELMVDVSQFNLNNSFYSIGDFKAFILNNNIKYVYIRAGGRGYGKAGNLYKDTNYKDYADACEYLKVPFGFYFLDEAISSEEIDEEIRFIEDFLEENNYENNILPIALDVEKHIETGRADDIWDTRYILVNEMVEKLNRKNKQVIIYSNAAIANKYLTEVNANLWLAYYPNVKEKPNFWYSDTDEEGATNTDLILKMVAWQFTETGISRSISKEVDLSIVYNEFFKLGSVNDIKNDVSGSSKPIQAIFKLKNKWRNIDIFSLGKTIYI